MVVVVVAKKGVGGTLVLSHQNDTNLQGRHVSFRLKGCSEGHRQRVQHPVTRRLHM